MDGFLIYYKKKSNPVRVRCTLVVNKKEPSNSEFLVYSQKNPSQVEQRIPFLAIKRLSHYNDMSWEFTTDNANYHFKADNLQENARWYEIMNKNFYHKSNPYYGSKKPVQQPDLVASSNNKDPRLPIGSSDSYNQRIPKPNGLSNANKINTNLILDESIYDLRIMPSLTSRRLVGNFSLIDTYQLSVEYSGISLTNKTNRVDTHFFSARVIRKYGATAYCFAIQLGHLSNLNEGVIAFESSKYKQQKAKQIYAHINDLVDKTFFNLLVKMNHYGHRNQCNSNTATATSRNYSDYNKSKATSLSIQNRFEQANNGSENYYYSPSLAASRPQTLSLKRPSSQPPPLPSGTPPVITTTNIEIRASEPESDSDLQVYRAVVINRTESSPKLRKDIFNNSVELNVNERRPSTGHLTIIHNNVISNVDGDEDDHDDRTPVDEYRETESFYEEKYVPQYMSNKNMVSPPIDYFEDENAIYGRVQL